MENICNILFSRLKAKGLVSVEIQRLIKDTFNILDNMEQITSRSVNQYLERLGWEQHMFDDYTFELVLFLFENKKPNFMK
ncbi:hypothetical protein QUF76_04135 [Desulfobacterales bacterium HSG16]|nr:hypothetical protein [Desulfobacterales bacterium HSG16]